MKELTLLAMAWVALAGCSAESSDTSPYLGQGGSGGKFDGGAGAAGKGVGGTTGHDAAAGGSAGTGGVAGSGAQAGAAGTAVDGGSGGVAGAAGAAPTELDLHQATLYDNPVNMGDWPVTTTITYLEFQYNGGDGVHVEFSKKDGPESWPDITPPGWDGPLEYTMGMAEFINGQWYASAAIQFWRGLEASGGNVALDNQVAKNWYYDARWGELSGRQPATGELIGIFVVAGNVRGVHDDGSQSPVKERSNVVLVPMPDVNGAKHTF